MRQVGAGGWKIATIRGVALKIHFSLLFLLLYVVILATAQFPFVLERAGLSAPDVGGSPVIWSLAFALGLFLSVTLHELSHTLVAQAMGVRVEGITLMMLGGVSEMERIPEEPYAEFKVSIVGPLVSFAIAGLLFLAHSRELPAPLSFLSYWLARANLALGIFNLLPALPLDGGRAFRSLLAARRGMASATATAVRVAKGLAWALGIAGLLGFNFLLMLIAVFIYSAANSELVLSVSRGLLKGLTAGDVYKEAPALHESDSLLQAANAMSRSRHRVLPVETPSGAPAVLSIELLKSLPRNSWGSGKVGDLAMQVPRFLSTDTVLEEILPELAAARVLPVKDGGRIVGIVSYSEIMQMVELRSLSERSSSSQAA